MRRLSKNREINFAFLILSFHPAVFTATAGIEPK